MNNAFESGRGVVVDWPMIYVNRKKSEENVCQVRVYRACVYSVHALLCRLEPLIYNYWKKREELIYQLRVSGV